MTSVPFLDLGKVNAPHGEALQAAAARVIAGGWYVQGEACEAFEQAFAAHAGVRHAIGVGNGLDALTLTLRACIDQGRLRPGDGVVVPANSFVASALAVTAAGLSPVLVDPDPDTFNLSPAAAERALDEGARAVMAVHLYGRIAPVEALAALCRDRGALLLEDAAQAHGAGLRGRRAGAWGAAAGFSFYPGKNLGALGDAGAATTDDDDLAARLRALRNYGSEVKYEHRLLGVNSRLDELQAALLGVKLPALDGENARRRGIAGRYLAEIRHPDVRLPIAPETADEHVWHLFVVRTGERDRLAAHLHARGVLTQIHYPIPIHRQACYAGRFDGAALPVAERLSREVLSLPMSPALTEEEVTRVVDGVNAYPGDAR